MLLLDGHANRWSERDGWQGRCGERAEARRLATVVRLDTSIDRLFALAEGRRVLIAFLQTHRRR